jgi:hypothetical protein
MHLPTERRAQALVSYAKNVLGLTASDRGCPKRLHPNVCSTRPLQLRADARAQRESVRVMRNASDAPQLAATIGVARSVLIVFAQLTKWSRRRVVNGRRSRCLELPLGLREKAK